jgi:hypothetical protein
MKYKKGVVAVPWIIALLIAAILIFVFYLPATFLIYEKTGKAKYGAEFTEGDRLLTETENLIAISNTLVKTNEGFKSISDMILGYDENKNYKEELSLQKSLLNSLTYKDVGCSGFCLLSYRVKSFGSSNFIAIESENFDTDYCLSSIYLEKNAYCRIFASLFISPEDKLKIELTKAMENFENG